MRHFSRFSQVWEYLTRYMVNAPDVYVGEWQAKTHQDQDLPQHATLELEDASFSMDVPETMQAAQRDIMPNLPWAEKHFQERVSGYPHNPPPSHVEWPHATRDNDEHTDVQGKFSHTYPERFWPRYAGDSVHPHPPMRGIRYNYGDLNDLILLLINRPHTRQAYLPVWFPEDLFAAAHRGERVPCTLGYHFMRRRGSSYDSFTPGFDGDRMKCVYYIRSCDLLRHFKDDVYLAVRLLQYVVDRINSPGLKPGRLVMHVSSLHVFGQERDMVRTIHSQAVLDESVQRHDRLTGGWL